MSKRHVPTDAEVASAMTGSWKTVKCPVCNAGPGEACWRRPARMPALVIEHEREKPHRRRMLLAEAP